MLLQYAKILSIYYIIAVFYCSDYASFISELLHTSVSWHMHVLVSYVIDVNFQVSYPRCIWLSCIYFILYFSLKMWMYMYKSIYVCNIWHEKLTYNPA